MASCECRHSQEARISRRMHMAILSKKEKLKLVRRYIGGQYVPAPEAFRSRTSFKASLLNWVKRYRLCGRREGEGSPVPQRPGLAVPEEGVRGHPEGIRQDPDDVAEGELPRQLGNGELLRGLKAEMFYGQEDRYGDYGSLKKAIVEYINWYNSSRLKEYLHWKSPQEALSNSGTL